MKTDIFSTLEYFKGKRYYIQLKALTLLGATSDLRAEELYQFDKNDMDFEHRTVYAKHDPGNGKTTKTKQSRATFFSGDAKISLLDYLQFYSEKRFLKDYLVKPIFYYDSVVPPYRSKPSVSSSARNGADKVDPNLLRRYSWDIVPGEMWT